MDTLKKTYRFSAALLLILFASNILLPAGMAAASLNCDMEMPINVQACCTTADMNSHHEKKKDTHDCEQQAFCEQIIASSQSDIPAVTQNSKIVIAAKISDKLITIIEDSDHPPAIRDEFGSLHHHPPIFLLNSTFLN